MRIVFSNPMISDDVNIVSPCVKIRVSSVLSPI